MQKNSLPIILFAGKCRQSASKLRANLIDSPSAGRGTLPAYRALFPSAGLVRIVRTFFQTAGTDTERKDGQIATRKFDHPDRTKDLAGIGKSQRVLSTGAGVAVAGVVSWIRTKPACPILNFALRGDPVRWRLFQTKAPNIWDSSQVCPCERGSPHADLLKRRFQTTKLIRAQFREHSLHLAGMLSKG